MLTDLTTYVPSAACLRAVTRNRARRFSMQRRKLSTGGSQAALPTCDPYAIQELTSFTQCANRGLLFLAGYDQRYTEYV